MRAVEWLQLAGFALLIAAFTPLWLVLWLVGGRR